MKKRLLPPAVLMWFPGKNKSVGIAIMFLLAAHGLCLTAAFAAVKQEVYLTGTVQSFGGYVFTEGIHFSLKEPGMHEIGNIVVEGHYNGEYPWIMRVYTDNLHFSGVGGAVRYPGAGGLVSKDGRFIVPLQIQSPALGEDVWRRIPDINDPDYIPYRPSAEPGEVDYTDCIVMAIDPRNASWVAGPDGLLFTDDDNLLGDLTAKTPFELALRTEATSTTVQGDYDGFLYIEIVPAP